MTIFDYIKKYNYTFEEKPFNEIDNVIFSTLAYPNYEGIISSDLNNKKKLSSISKEFFKKNPKIARGEITAIKIGTTLLKEFE